MIGPVPYIGGKRRIATQLARLIPDHIAYVEPFAGGAQVFFHKAPSPVEVLNDLDHEVINFFRICQVHHPELLRLMRYWVASRRLFEELLRVDASTLTDVHRAARWLYLQRNAFGGRIRQRAFRYAVTSDHSFHPDRLPRVIAQAAERLKRVQLEELPYQEILTRYDRPTTFFYVDPPYVGAKLYTYNFVDADFTALADRLRTLQGKFILSINDHPVARTAFSGFVQRSVRLSYTATRSVPKVTELLIANFPLPALNEAA